jgi:hypothetical protein
MPIGTVASVAAKYVLPSLIQMAGSMLGGSSAAKLQERSTREQMKFTAGENAKSRMVDLYNSATEQAWAEYASKKDAVRAKRLRASIIEAFGDVLAVGGPNTIMPYTPNPQMPTQQGVAQQTRGLSDILLAGR